MNLQLVFQATSFFQELGTYVLLFLSAAALGWIFFYRLGSLVAGLVPSGKAKSRYDFGIPLSICAGLWIFPSFALIAGLFGQFTTLTLGILAIGIVVHSILRKQPVLPRFGSLPPGSWASLAARGSLLTAFLLGFASFFHFAPWFDGNFLVAGGHLARTGFYLVDQSDGQPGMVTLVALMKIVFGDMSALQASIAWGPFYGPFLFLGIYFLLREIFEEKKLAAFAFLLFTLPFAFKAQEIRASVTGFGLGMWCLVFMLRHLRTKDTRDLAGAVFCLSAAWNFGQFGALYMFVFIATWSAGSYLSGDSKRARLIWRTLFWTNVIEWLHIALTFRWSLGQEAVAWKLALPGTFTLGLAYAVDRLLQFPSRIKIDRRWLAPLFLVTTLAALLANPWWKPVYNWVHFKSPAWFGYLNFTSFGLPGWAFLASLLLALWEIWRQKASRASVMLWMGFFVSALIQLTSALLISSGSSTLSSIVEPALTWDLWKDSTLYWNNPFMVLGYAYLAHRCLTGAGTAKRPVRRTFDKRLWAVIAFSCLFCLQRFEPYRVFFANPADPAGSIEASLKANLSPDVDIDWRGQQSYSFPMYLAFGLLKDFRLGDHRQLEQCSFCTTYTYGFMKDQLPVIEFLLHAPVGAGEGFITSDSILTREVYLNRQIRYRDGANTVCPIYVHYLDQATLPMYYWKPKMRIRRNSAGMAYSIVHPERNIQWPKPASNPDGSLSITISVPRDGDYEIYRGREQRPSPVTVYADSGEFKREDSISSGWLRLNAGTSYRLKLVAPKGEGALDPEIPIALYPRRYWNYEKYLLEKNEPAPFGNIGIMRFTGIPTPDIAIEDMQEIMTLQDPRMRQDTLMKLRIRFIIMDPLLQKLFPTAVQTLRQDPLLDMHLVNGIPIFEFNGPALHAKK